MTKKKKKKSETEIVASLVGRTIIAAEWFDAYPDQEWGGPHETARLVLDDGRTIEFTGYGYDACGGEVYEVEAS